MKHPGFTAEASLYKSNGHYAMAWGGAISTPRILPQQVLSDACVEACQWCGLVGDPMYSLCTACYYCTVGSRDPEIIFM